MSSRGVIDLRSPKSKKHSPRGQGVPGQGRLFAARPGGSAAKPMPLRARRRRQRSLIFLAVVFLVGGIAYGISYASYLPEFSIRAFDVRGAYAVSPQLVADVADTVVQDGSYHFLSRNNIFLYPRAEIAQKLTSYFPRIRSVQISRASLFATVAEISLEERQMFALWCTDAATSTCYAMDEGGFLFAEAPYASSTQYIFRGGIPEAASSTDLVGRSFVQGQLPGLLSVLRALGQAGSLPLGATAVSGQDVIIPLARGFYIKASFGQEGGALAKNLQLVLSSDALQGHENELEYVDLRFGNRVYYKLKGAAEASPGQ